MLKNTDVQLPADRFTVSEFTETTSRSGKARYYFLTMSILFLILALLGFVPHYSQPRPFPIHWFAHVHGTIMTAWLLVFITQTTLGATSRFKFHRQVGMFAVGLGVLAWISMGVVSARALTFYNPSVEHFLFDVLIVQLYGMLLFGVFFFWGIAVRKNAGAHKRLLFLATLVLMQAGIDRIRWLPLFGMPYPLGFFMYLDALLLSLFIYDWITIKGIHKITWVGLALVVAVQAAVLLIWGSPGWHRFWFDVVN